MRTYRNIFYEKNRLDKFNLSLKINFKKSDSKFKLSYYIVKTADAARSPDVLYSDNVYVLYESHNANMRYIQNVEQYFTQPPKTCYFRIFALADLLNGNGFAPNKITLHNALI